MASRPLICPESGQSGYGSAPAFGNARQVHGLRRPARIIFGVCSALVLVLVVMSGQLKSSMPHRVDLAQALDDKIDAEYLQAEGSGKSGKAFLKKLQDMWFVAQYR
jgi:hypothetical protein